MSVRGALRRAGVRGMRVTGGISPASCVPARGVDRRAERRGPLLRGSSCDGQRDRLKGARGRTRRTMTLDQSALLEVLEALKSADVEDRVRSAAETIYQALIEAELTSVIGAAPHERSDTRTAQRNGH